MKNFIPYIGGKYGLVKEISRRLHDTGRTCLVDMFGGSGTVTIHSGFRKRIYNDINGDIVNLFRVMACDGLRRRLLRMLRWTPPARQVFEEDREIFRQGEFSFKLVVCRVERAKKTLYRHVFCFGGKTRTGGLAISTCDRKSIKEVLKYHNVLRSLSLFGRFFMDTVIENLDFADLIEKYGCKEQVVFFADPPYPGFSAYYSDNLSTDRHRELAVMLLETPAPSVCTFYDHKLIRNIYPDEAWTYEDVKGRRNSVRGGEKDADELILTKRDISQEQSDRLARRIKPQRVMCFERSEKEPAVKNER